MPALGIDSVECHDTPRGSASSKRHFVLSGATEGHHLDSPKTEKAVLKAVTATGFIKGLIRP